MSSTQLLFEELTAFCQSDSLSEIGLREIIQRHNWTPNREIIERHDAPDNDDPSINSDHAFFLEVCRNEKVTEGILRYLLENFPNAAIRQDNSTRPLLLQMILYNKNVTLGMVQLLIDTLPNSPRHQRCTKTLCDKINLDESIGLDILKLLLKKYPESVRHAGGYGLPIHCAAMKRSPEFCRLLIEAYPGSERMGYGGDRLPFHRACQYNTVTTAKYLYELYPESINVATNQGITGRYPIHCTIMGLKQRGDNASAAVEIVAFLLDCAPNVVSQKFQHKLPLYWACKGATNENTPKLNAYLKVLQTLYDAYPDAILDNQVTANVGSFCEEVQTFINSQITYVEQTKDHHLMHSPDENGQLPLHKALRDNVTLGSIKLLVKGNPSAIMHADNRGMLPLHIACQHHESASVIEYLINLAPTALHVIDLEQNTSLHHACRGANHAIITLLLEKYDGSSISKRNAHNQLPVHLLFESDVAKAGDREGIEYTESVYRLIRGYPVIN